MPPSPYGYSPFQGGEFGGVENKKEVGVPTSFSYSSILFLVSFSIKRLSIRKPKL